MRRLELLLPDLYRELAAKRRELERVQTLVESMERVEAVLESWGSKPAK